MTVAAPRLPPKKNSIELMLRAEASTWLRTICLRESSSQKRSDGPGKADGCGYHAEGCAPRLWTIGSARKRHPQAGNRRTANRLDNSCRQQLRKSRRHRAQEGAG